MAKEENGLKLMAKSMINPKNEGSRPTCYEVSFVHLLFV
jgi:hypothetical protein